MVAREVTMIIVEQFQIYTRHIGLEIIRSLNFAELPPKHYIYKVLQIVACVYVPHTACIDVVGSSFLSRDNFNYLTYLTYKFYKAVKRQTLISTKPIITVYEGNTGKYLTP